MGGGTRVFTPQLILATTLLNSPTAALSNSVNVYLLNGRKIDCLFRKTRLFLYEALLARITRFYIHLANIDGVISESYLHCATK